MDASSPTLTYTVEDLHRLTAAREQIRQFTAWLLTRLTAYSQTGTAVTGTDRPLSPIEDATQPDSGGYGHWSVLSWDATAPGPVFRHWLDGDRGPGHETARVHVPWSFIFGDDEREARRQLYLQLKEEFE